MLVARYCHRQTMSREHRCRLASGAHCQSPFRGRCATRPTDCAGVSGPLWVEDLWSEHFPRSPRSGRDMLSIPPSERLSGLSSDQAVSVSRLKLRILYHSVPRTGAPCLRRRGRGTTWVEQDGAKPLPVVCGRTRLEQTRFPVVMNDGRKARSCLMLQRVPLKWP
jgi:hypothetical protein